MATPPANTVPNDLPSIDANRFGQLTPWQRKQLPPPPVLGSSVALALSVAVALGGVGFFLGFPLWAALRDGAPLFSPPLSPADLLLPGLFLGITGLFLLVVSRLLLIPCTSRLLFKLRLRSDLAQGVIAQEEGQVLFVRQRGYTARGTRGTLCSLYGSWAVNLPPGTYHFYYLPHSRRILSAERQAFLEPGGSPASLLSALAAAHSFRLEELPANRQGRVSARQRFGLVGRVLLLFVLLIALVVWAIVLLQHGPLGLLVQVPIAALLLYLIARRWQDLLEGRVVPLEGNVLRKEETDGDGDSTYYYTLGNKEFRVSRDAYEALIPGEHYRLYLLPRSRRLVSIEPLP